MKKKMFLSLAVLVGLLCGCSSQDESPQEEKPEWIGDPLLGYFRTEYGFPFGCYVNEEGGDYEVQLFSSLEEKVIPIKVIANKLDYLYEPQYHIGDAVEPAAEFFAHGKDPAFYPYIGDYFYRFNWAEFATDKLDNSDKGVLYIHVDPLPEDMTEPRKIYLRLSNEQEGVLRLVQAPEGYPFNLWTD